MIDACANDGQYKSAISLLNDMEDKYGVEPNDKCYNAAISSCEKAAKWEEAVKLLRKMTEKGVEPNVLSYSSVISACEKCAEWEKALEFLAEMKKWVSNRMSILTALPSVPARRGNSLILPYHCWRK